MPWLLFVQRRLTAGCRLVRSRRLHTLFNKPLAHVAHCLGMALPHCADPALAFAFLALEQNWRPPHHRRLVPPFILACHPLLPSFSSLFHAITFVHPCTVPYPQFSPTCRSSRVAAHDTYTGSRPAGRSNERHR